MTRTKSQYFFYALLVIGILISSFYLRQFIIQNNLPSFNGWFSLSFLLAISMAVGLQMIAHWIRAWKSRLLLEVIRPTKVRTLFKGLSIGFLFNALLPFRLGEFIRAHVIGESMSISRTVVFCTILMERALDGIILGLTGITLALIFGLEHKGFPVSLLYLATLTVILSILVGWLLTLLNSQDHRLIKAINNLSLIFNDGLRDHIRLISWSAIYGLNIIFSRARLMLYVLASLVMWVLYGLSMIWLIIAILTSLPAIKQIAFALAAYLSVAIPSGPAYLGTFQQSMVSTGHGLTINDAALFVASIVSWMLLIIPISVSGAALLFLSRTKPRSQKRTASAEIMKNKLFRDADISNEFSHFLDAYFAGTHINQVLHNYEAKTNFRLVSMFKGGSNALTLLGWDSGELTVKKLTLPQYAPKLKAQYDWLKERQSLPHMPKLGEEEIAPDYYSINITYHEDYIPFFDFIHLEQIDRSKALLEDLFKFMQSAIYQLREKPDSRSNLESYIGAKVIDKVADTATLDPQIATLLEFPDLEINGEVFMNFTQVIEKIRQRDDIMQELSQYHDTPIHGDLTIDNIIVSRVNGDYILLDPNNENQVSDPVVDLGKLYQSLHSGYEFLCQLNRAEVVENRIAFEESLSSKYSQLFTTLDTRLKLDLSPTAYRSLLFHEAVHYCRLLTYRAKISPTTLPVFYAIAVRLFNQFLCQYEPY